MNNKIKGDLGEDVVNKLAFGTYLKYWCFPSPKDDLGNKKEICDLLILFQNTAIIFSIKNYSFNGNYERYFRLTLNKALAQIKGAERKLFETLSKLSFTHFELGQIDFDSSKYNEIFRIVINLNDIPLFYPAGKTQKDKKFVHIFNWEAFLGIVLELNTIPDLIDYLREREATYQNHDVIILQGDDSKWNEDVRKIFLNYCSSTLKDNFVLIAGNEQDILAEYLFNRRKFNKQFHSDEFNGASFEFDGSWQNYLQSKDVQKKKEEDKDSYFIDEFVKREVLYKHDQYNLEIATELLALSRFERRIAGKTFLEFAKRYENQNGYFVARRYGKVKDLVIAFILHGHEMKHEHVMTTIQIAIEGYCYWANYPKEKILAIAVSNKLVGFKFGFLREVEPFDKEYESEVIENLKILNWFTNIETTVFNHKEYPE
jgi:hypothetical protein